MISPEKSAAAKPFSNLFDVALNTEYDICNDFAFFQWPTEDSISCRFRAGNYARLAAAVVDSRFLWWDVVAEFTIYNLCGV